MADREGLRESGEGVMPGREREVLLYNVAEPIHEGIKTSPNQLLKRRVREGGGWTG